MGAGASSRRKATKAGAASSSTAPPPASNAKSIEATKVSQKVLDAEIKRALSVGDVKLRKLQLREVPPALMDVKNVRKLDLSWNVFKELPSSHFEFHNELTEVRIAYNELELIPESIGMCENVSTLDFRSNNIVFLPQQLETLVKLKELFLSSNRLNQFPHEIRKLDIERLDLSSNDIVRVGKTLGTLSELQALSLSHNKIASLPEEVGRLKYLVILEASHNGLKALPPQLGQCTHLDTLDVSHNLLQRLPKELKNLTHLRVLRANNNEIIALNLGLAELENIEELDMSNNRLRLIGVEVKYWKKLSLLSLADNNIHWLPPDLGYLPLKALTLTGNPHVCVPKRAIEEGTEAILLYFQTIGEQHRLLEEYISGFNTVIEDNASSSRASTPLLLKGAETGPPETKMDDTASTTGSTESGRIRVQNSSKQMKTHSNSNEWRKLLDQDPRLAKLKPLIDRRDDFQQSLLITRQFLLEHDMTYGQTARRKIIAAEKSGFLNLYSCNLKSVPPEVKNASQVLVADIRQNEIMILDDSLQCRQELEVLNMSHNKLDSMTKAEMPNLRVLNLAFNCLNHITDDIGRCSMLEVLYLSGNSLATLPDTCGALMLTDLYLGENKLEHFPLCITQIKTLKKLSLSCNDITEIPASIANLSEMQYLDLSFNKLTALPADFGSLALERLNISFNSLEAFPNAITRLINLQELNMDYCEISRLPVEVGELISLDAIQLKGNALAYPFHNLYHKSPLNVVHFYYENVHALDLSSANLHTLPKEIGRLREIKTLDLRDNSLKDLPIELGLCIRLQELRLEGNPLDSPFAEISRQPYGYLAIVNFLDKTSESVDLTGAQLDVFPELLMRHAAACVSLCLTNNQIQFLPPETSNFLILQHLVLDANGFTDFPMCLHSLPGLETLSMRHNSLTKLPVEAFTMASLKVLDVSHNEIVHLPDVSAIANNFIVELELENNRIETFPNALCMSKHLLRLNLKMNDIKVLSGAIGHLSNLQYLDVAINDLSYLPDQIGHCVGLRELNVNSNNLLEIPDTIANIQGLSRLQAAGNKLTLLPSTMLSMTALETLFLFGNPLPEIPLPLNVSEPYLVQNLIQVLLLQLAEDLRDMTTDLEVPDLTKSPPRRKDVIKMLEFTPLPSQVATPRNAAPTSGRSSSPLPLTPISGVERMNEDAMNPSHKVSVLPLA